MEPTSRIGPYVVRGVVGRGAMGMVLRGYDPAVGREVAIKLLLAAADPAQRARFAREGRLVAALDHPGIVRIHSAGELPDGRPYLAFELVEGARTLADALRELPRLERLRVVVEVARALGHAHARGVVHRDLKPENVLLDAAGHARLADFGVAIAGDQERLTRTGALVGTPLYMAPEQLGHRTGEVGPAVDVWALGVLLYEALTDALPFQGTSLPELVAAIARARPTPPRGLDRSVPAGVEAVCLRALRADPAARYPDGSAFADDLERALVGGRPAAAERAASRRLALGALALAALALGALAVWAWTREAASPPESAAAPPTAPADASADEVTTPEPPGWRLRAGQRFHSRVTFLIGRLAPPPALAEAYRLTVDLDEHVRAVEAGWAAIEARLARIRLRANDPMPFDLDTAGTIPDFFAWRPDCTFTYRLELATGRPSHAEGLTALRRSFIRLDRQSGLGLAIDRALILLDDERFATGIGPLLAVPTWTDGPTARLEQSLEVGLVSDTRVDVTYEVAFDGLDTRARMLGWRAPPTYADSVRALTIEERSQRFADGRLLAAVLAGETDLTAPQEAVRFRFRITYDGSGVEEPGAVAGDPYERLYREGAEKGQPQAMVELAQALGARAAHEEALMWLERAAQAGSAKALFKLALAHHEGRGTPKDSTRAVALGMRAGAAGEARGYALAGELLLEGDGLPPERRDVQRGLELLRRAAEAGHGPATLYLARTLRAGKRVPLDLAGAAEAYQLAVADGNATAMLELADLLMKRRPRRPDDVEAARRLVERARADRPESTSRLLKRYPELR